MFYIIWMEYYLELGSLAILSIISLLMFIIGFKKYKLSWHSGIYFLFYSFLLVYCALESYVLINTSGLVFLKLKKYLFATLCANMGIILILYINFAFRIDTPKKIKVLWRLPFITYLVALFNINYISFELLFILLIILIIFFKHKAKLVTLTPNIVGLVTFTIVSFLIIDISLWSLNMLCLGQVILVKSLWDRMYIKSLNLKEIEQVES